MMERKTATRKADAIIVSDLHLSDTTPVSRTDDFLETQRIKLEWLCDLQQKHGDCVVLNSGDLFDFWKISPWLASMAFKYLPRNMIVIPGNHDLPEHAMKLYNKSGMALLQAVRKDMMVMGVIEKEPPIYMHGKGMPISQVIGVAFGELDKFVVDKGMLIGNGRNILLLHEQTWPGMKPPWPGAEGYSATELLHRFADDFDLIITGDNHNGFVEHYHGSVLVNPGSMLRLSADKVNYQPRAYLYYAQTNEVIPQYFPIQDGVVDTSHLDIIKDRDQRLAAYISQMDTTWDIGLSFEKNLEAYFAQNDTPKKIKELIWHHLQN